MFLGAVTGRDMNGVQISGISNIVGGSMRGIQVAGITNINGDNLSGLSVSGLVGITGNHAGEWYSPVWPTLQATTATESS